MFTNNYVKLSLMNLDILILQFEVAAFDKCQQTTMKKIMKEKKQ